MSWALHWDFRVGQPESFVGLFSYFSSGVAGAQSIWSEKRSVVSRKYIKMVVHFVLVCGF